MKSALAGGFAFFLIFLMLLGFSSALAAQEKRPESSENYVIGIGDALEVAVFEEPEISKSVTVRLDGRISLPLVGEFMAADKTPASLADTITRRLDKFVEAPNVTVILSESRSKNYYILGQIQEPGQYPIAQPITVLQAIARAGGFQEWADKSRIKIVSGPGDRQKVRYFNYDAFLEEDGAEQNMVIQPGDTIVIP